LGAVNDAQVFAAAHLQSGLNKSLLASCNERARLDHHPFAAVGGQSLPPFDGVTNRFLACKRDRAPLRARYHAVRGGGQTVSQPNMPNMVLVEPNTSLAREKMERRDLEIVDARDWPDIGCPSFAIERGTLGTIGKMIAHSRDFETTIACPSEGFRRCSE